MMRLPFRVEVFWHTDETRKKKDAGIDFALTECEIKTIPFYNIDRIEEYIDDKDNNTEYSTIYSGGDKYICPYTQDLVEEMLNNHLTAIFL